MQVPSIPPAPKLVQVDPIAVQRKSMQHDLIYFKEDILKSMRNIDSKLKNQFEANTEALEQRLVLYDSKLEAMTQKIADLSTLINKDNSIYERLDQLAAFKSATESTLTTHEVKQNMISKELRDAIFKYDKVIVDNLIYPGVIGNSCKFRTFKDFIDYLLKQDSLFITFRDKQILDLKTYKQKLENLTKSLQSQIDSITLATTQFTNRAITESEERIKNLMKIYDDRLEDMRVENGKYAIQLKNQSSSLSSEWNKVMNIKNEIYAKFENEVQEMKKSNSEAAKHFDRYKKEFKLIKNRFTQLSEFIKDVRFRINIGKSVTKKETNQMGNAINFDKKQVLKESDEKKANVNHPRGSLMVESFLKKYIKGEVDINTVMNQGTIRKSIESSTNINNGVLRMNSINDKQKASQSTTNVRYSLVNKLSSSQNILEDDASPVRSRIKQNQSVHISRKQFLDDVDIIHNRLSNNKNNNNNMNTSSEKGKNKSYSKKISYMSKSSNKSNINDSMSSSSGIDIENSIIDEEEMEKEFISNQNNNIKDQPRKSKSISKEKVNALTLNEEKSNDNTSNTNKVSFKTEQNKKYNNTQPLNQIKNETQSDGNSNNTKEDKHAISINDKSDNSKSVSRRNKNESLPNTYSFPQLSQSKSYALLPAINTKMLKQTNTTAGNNSSNVITTSKGSNRQNNQANVIVHNSFRKTGQMRIGMASSKSQENIFIQKQNQHYKSTSNRSPESYPNPNKKNTINQIEDYIQQIKVFIPNTGLESEYNPYASPYSSDQLIKGKTIQMNNIAIFNNYGNKSKSQKRMMNGNSPKKGKYKDYSNNYYYNMMVNEDRQNNKFSPLSLIIKNESKTVQNKSNNLFLKNSRDSD